MVSSVSSSIPFFNITYTTSSSSGNDGEGIRIGRPMYSSLTSSLSTSGSLSTTSSSQSVSSLSSTRIVPISPPPPLPSGSSTPSPALNDLSAILAQHVGRTQAMGTPTLSSGAVTSRSSDVLSAEATMHAAVSRAHQAERATSSETDVLLREILTQLTEQNRAQQEHIALLRLEIENRDRQLGAERIAREEQVRDLRSQISDLTSRMRHIEHALEVLKPLHKYLFIMRGQNYRYDSGGNVIDSFSDLIKPASSLRPTGVSMKTTLVEDYLGVLQDYPRRSLAR